MTPADNLPEIPNLWPLKYFCSFLLQRLLYPTPPEASVLCLLETQLLLMNYDWNDQKNFYFLGIILQHQMNWHVIFTLLT